jgi:hypothetical protein
MGTELHVDEDYYVGKSANNNVLDKFTGTETGVDFIYEYSDLNFLQTRVKVLTGEYEGLILEYGGSGIAQWEDKNEFSFKHTIYEAPEKLLHMNESQASNLEKFLALLLCDVVAARRNDPKEKEKMTEAFLRQSSLVGRIKINNVFYSR